MIYHPFYLYYEEHTDKLRTSHYHSIISIEIESAHPLPYFYISPTCCIRSIWVYFNEWAE